MMKRILFLQKPELLAAQRDEVEAILRAEWPGVVVDAAGAAGEVPEGTHYDAIITPTTTWLPEALARTGGYDWIHFLSAGVERIWDMRFEKAGVTLTKSSGVHAIPIAEYVLGAMLFFTKRFDRYLVQSRARTWAREWADELSGHTVLVLGAGTVGRKVIERCEALGMKTLSVRRTAGSVGEIDLESVDFIVVCLPYTQSTRGFVDRTLLSRVKRGTVLIDVSRGGVVDAEAVLEALDSGKLRGAALDVFDIEPLPEDSPFWNRENVIITPHISGSAPKYMQRALEIFIRNVRCKAAGQPLETEVDVDAGY